MNRTYEQYGFFKQNKKKAIYAFDREDRTEISWTQNEVSSLGDINIKKDCVDIRVMNTT